MALDGAKDGVAASRVGEIWAGSPVPAPADVEKEGFLRMPYKTGKVSRRSVH